MTNASPRTGDRSILRQRVRDGNTTQDRRGRYTGAPAILHYGFRPFFLLASLYAAFAVPAWLWMHHAGWGPESVFTGVRWHTHEMIFGYLAAVIAGFILTAVPNWTGRLPLSGAPLAFLAGLWLVGRIACTFGGVPLAVLIADIAFPVTLAGTIWREVLAGRNWKNIPIATMLTLFGVANTLDHAEAASLIPHGAATRLALAVAAMLIALIGGRIVPSFTRNWLVKAGSARLPAPFGAVDMGTLLATGLAAGLWALWPDRQITGMVLGVAAALLALRLARWEGRQVLRSPIVLILHVGYGWVALAFALLSASILAPGAIPGTAAIHALTAGAIGAMTLAVMTRATLGHTGRAIEADMWTSGIYASVNAGALLRVASPFSGSFQPETLAAGGLLWSGAFLLFALRYGPMLVTRRQ